VPGEPLKVTPTSSRLPLAVPTPLVVPSSPLIGCDGAQVPLNGSVPLEMSSVASSLKHALLTLYAPPPKLDGIRLGFTLSAPEPVDARTIPMPLPIVPSW
jgi:hypothetical protein